MAKQLTLRELGWGIPKTKELISEEFTFGPDVREQYRLAENIFRSVKPSEYNIFVYLYKEEQKILLKEKRAFEKDDIVEINLKDESTPNVELLRKIHNELINNKEMYLIIKKCGGSIIKSLTEGIAYYRRYYSESKKKGKPKWKRNLKEWGKKIGAGIGSAIIVALVAVLI